MLPQGSWLGDDFHVAIIGGKGAPREGRREGEGCGQGGGGGAFQRRGAERRAARITDPDPPWIVRRVFGGLTVPTNKTDLTCGDIIYWHAG